MRNWPLITERVWCDVRDRERDPVEGAESRSLSNQSEMNMQSVAHNGSEQLIPACLNKGLTLSTALIKQNLLVRNEGQIDGRKNECVRASEGEKDRDAHHEILHTFSRFHIVISSQ